jgi:hypothetical protein
MGVIGPQAPFTAILGSFNTSSEEAVAVLDEEDTTGWGALEEDEFVVCVDEDVTDGGISPCDKGVSEEFSMGSCEVVLVGSGVSGLEGSSPQAERPKTARPLANAAGTNL